MANKKTAENSNRLVLIEWEDSTVGTSGWWETAIKPAVVTVQSVGWLLYDGEDCKMIVPHLSESGHGNVKQQGCGDITIPASSVRKVVDLQLARLLKPRQQIGGRRLKRVKK